VEQSADSEKGNHNSHGENDKNQRVSAFWGDIFHNDRYTGKSKPG
jgi:hypothetical protein